VIVTPDSAPPEGWMPFDGPGWLEALRCRYPDGQDVIVFVRQEDSEYEVRDRTESDGVARTETVVGVRASRAEARALMVKTCRDWDSWIVRRPTLGCN
jgi:hypothetical protein